MATPSPSCSPAVMDCGSNLATLAGPHRLRNAVRGLHWPRVRDLVDGHPEPSLRHVANPALAAAAGRVFPNLHPDGGAARAAPAQAPGSLSVARVHHVPVMVWYRMVPLYVVLL
jgi:hypothetical protein